MATERARPAWGWLALLTALGLGVGCGGESNGPAGSTGGASESLAPSQTPGGASTAPGPSTDRGAPGGADDGLPERLADRETLVAPWARVVDTAVAEAATLRDGHLRVPAEHADALDDVRRYDVLVSGSTTRPFILRVLSMRRDDEALVFETESAQLTDALLKGSFDSRDATRTWSYGGRPADDFPADAPLADRQGAPQAATAGRYRTSRHALRNGGVSYTPMGTFGPTDLGLTNQGDLALPGDIFTSFGGHLGVSLNGRGTARLQPAYWLSMAIDFSSGRRSPNAPYFFSTRECETDAGCFTGSPAGGEKCVGYEASEWPEVDQAVTSKLEPYDTETGQLTEYCVYEPPEGGDVAIDGPNGQTMWVQEYHRCGDLLDTLEWVKTPAGQQCAKDWEVWYESQGEKGSRNPRSCHRSGRDAVAPYPAQLEWAKLVCSGSLSHFEFDLRAELDVGIEDFQFQAEGGGSTAWPLVTIPDTTIAGAAFAVGGLPVVVTFNFNLSVPLAVNAGTDIGFNADKPRFFGIRDIQIDGGGVHWYASERAYQQGHFGPPTSQRPGGYLDSLQFNDVDAPSGGDLKLPKFEARNFHGSVTLQAKPELNMLLYHAAGPFLEPFSPYVTLKGTAEEDRTCQVGVKAGAQGKVGLKAQLPFGLGADETKGGGGARKADLKTKDGIKKYLAGGYAHSWDLYDTCGDSEAHFQNFEYGPEGRKKINTDPMCEEGLDGLCYRKCLWGDCGDSGSGTGGADGGSGSGGGTGSATGGTGSATGGSGSATGGSGSTSGDGDPNPRDERGRPNDSKKGPSGGSFGCSTGGGLPVGPWLVGLLGLAWVRRRKSSPSSNRG